MYMATGDLNRLCASDSRDDLYGCMHYIAGVIDYHTLMQSLGTAPTIGYCLPETLTMQQAAFAVIAYVRKMPQHADFIAASVVPLALNKLYPCRSATKPASKKKKR